MEMGQTPIINLLPSTKIICEGASNSLWGIQYCSSTSAASTHGLTACLVMNPGDGFGNWIVSPRGEAIVGATERKSENTEWKYQPCMLRVHCPEFAVVEIHGLNVIQVCLGSQLFLLEPVTSSFISRIHQQIRPQTDQTSLEQILEKPKV